jgi:hypothetical protein
MNHFGRPIQDYFPWFRYNGLEAPNLNNELFTQIRDCVPYKFSHLVTLWLRQGNAHIVGLEFMSGKEICYDPGSNLAWLSLSHDSVKFTPESFLDIEKMRLMYLLGIRENAQEYLKFIDEVMKMNEKIEYYQILIDDVNTGYKINLTNLRKVSNEVDLYSEIKFTEKELTDIIRDYDGSNTFLHSLKNHLHKTGSLTYRQLNAVGDKRNLKDLGVTIDEDKICIELEYAPNKEVYDELRTMTNRFRLDGYKVLECNDKTIIY